MDKEKPGLWPGFGLTTASAASEQLRQPEGDGTS